MLDVEHRVAFGAQLPERGARPRIHGQRIGTGRDLRLVVEQDVALADLDERIAHLRQHQRDIGLRPLDPVRLDRIADLQRQLAAHQIRRNGLRGLHVDRAERVEPSRLRADDCLQPPGLFGHGFDRRDCGRVIIAERLQQPDDQRLVFLRARRNLRRVRRLAAALQRGQGLVARLEPVAGIGQTLNLRVVTDLGRILVLDVRSSRQWCRVVARERGKRHDQLRIFGTGGGQDGARRGRRGGHIRRGGHGRRLARHRLERCVDVVRKRRQRLVEFRVGDDRGVALGIGDTCVGSLLGRGCVGSLCGRGTGLCELGFAGSGHTRRQSDREPIVPSCRTRHRKHDPLSKGDRVRFIPVNPSQRTKLGLVSVIRRFTRSRSYRPPEGRWCRGPAAQAVASHWAPSRLTPDPRA